MKSQPLSQGTPEAMIATCGASIPRARRALREPMVWLIILLPLASVVFAFWLLSAAVRSGGADDIGEEVQSTGEAQVADLGPDAKAHALGLVAVLHTDGKGIDVFPAQGDFQRGKPLVLMLRHPTDSRQDRRLLLSPDTTGWRLGDGLAAGHDWIAQLMPVDGSWRLSGRLRSGTHATRMEPAFAGE